MYNWRTGHARLGIRALEAAPKLHNYNSTRNKNSDTQKYKYIMHIKTYTHPKLTEEENDFKKFC